MEEENEDEFEKHVSDVFEAVGRSVAREKIAEELRKNMERVPDTTIYQAKDVVVKKYGGDPRVLRYQKTKTLVELQGGEKSVNIVCKILSVRRKSIMVDGVQKTIHEGVIADHTGTMKFTAWVEDFAYKNGDVVRIVNAYTKVYRGAVELNIGERGVIVREAETALPAERAVLLVRLKDIRPGMRGVSTKFKVISLKQRDVVVAGEEKRLLSGMVADGSGRALLSVWADLGIEEGGEYRVDGAYVTSWKGIPQLNLDLGMAIERINENIAVTENIVALGRVEEIGGAADAVVEGFIVDIKSGSGIIQRCQNCERVVRDEQCPVHGAVKVRSDMRIKAVIDDGTGTATLIMGRTLTENMVGHKLEEALRSPEIAVEVEKKINSLFAREMRVRGNITKDDFGLMLVAELAELLDTDCEKEARAMLANLQE